MTHIPERSFEKLSCFLDDNDDITFDEALSTVLARGISGDNRRERFISTNVRALIGKLAQEAERTTSK